MSDDDGGKYRSDSPAHVVAGAAEVGAASQRAELADILGRAGPIGRTSKELAAYMSATHGPSAPIARTNQISTRLGELFEAGHAAPARERGCCMHGVCVTHRPEAGLRHLPTTPCRTHGDLVVRSRAMVWRAT